jgi:hypothetical protein
MSLSSLGLLWEITPFVDNLPHFWKRILTDLLEFFSDPRSDVATSALKTFFSLLSSNVMRIVPEIYDYLLTDCFVPFLQSLSLFNANSWIVQQIALLEICHCICAFWDRFASNPRFLSPFWELLIEKQEQLIVSCENQEICVACLQFYDEAFKGPISEPLREKLLLSFTWIIRFFFTMERPMALVLSTIGRFLVGIIPTQKPFLNEKQITLWLSSVQEITGKVVATTTMTLTAQKAIEAVMALFPIEIDIGLTILRAVVRIVAETPNGNVRACGIEFIREVLLPGEHFEYVLECRPLFGLPEAAKIVQLIGNQEFAIDGTNCRQVFELLEAIGAVGVRKLSERLLSFELEEQKRFIDDIEGDLQALLALWNRFCNSKLATFDRDFFDRSSGLILKYVFEHLEAGNEAQIPVILEFLKTSVAYPKEIGGLGESTRWHLFGVIPYLLPLLNRTDREIWTAAHEILGLLEIELEQMIVE